MARLSNFTVQVYELLRTVLASSALGMTRGIITLLNFCIPHYAYVLIFYYVSKIDLDLVNT